MTFGVVNVTAFAVIDDTTLNVTTPPHAAGAVDVVVTADGSVTSVGGFTYVTPAPVVTSVAPPSGSTAGGTVVTITGTDFTGATAVKFDGTSVAATDVSPTSVKATTPSHAAGMVDVQVVTPAGTSATNANAKFNYIAPGPTVTAVAPPGGPIAGGTLVTITGTGFGTSAAPLVTAVTFGGTPATSFSVLLDTTISAIAPAHAAGIVDVIVTAGGVNSDNTAADNYIYGDAPVVTAISPTSGNIAGGTVVTITGTGFTGASAVNFGATPGTITNTTATSLTVTAPAHAVGNVNVQVVTPLGTSADTTADDFTYTAGPTVTGLAPATGSITGGTTVVITGTGFTPAATVTFGLATATVTYNSATQLTATSPAHAAGTVDVLVTTAAGTSPNTTADNFVYGSGPNITLLSPSQGPVGGGTVVTITGTGFTGATGVTFDGVAGTNLVVVNDTSITIVSPAHANGVVRVAVTTPIGTSPDVVADNFTYGTGATATFTLYFRWSLIVWNGKNGADIASTLKGLESPDNPLTNDVSNNVTAIFYYNNPLQKFEGFFPGSAGIPGANDFTTFVTGRAYWIAINSTGSLNWTVATD